MTQYTFANQSSLNNLNYGHRLQLTKQFWNNGLLTTEDSKFKAKGAASGDEFDIFVSISEGRTPIGTYVDNNGSDACTAYLFQSSDPINCSIY